MDGFSLEARRLESRFGVLPRRFEACQRRRGGFFFALGGETFGESEERVAIFAILFFFCHFAIFLVFFLFYLYVSTYILFVHPSACM